MEQQRITMGQVTYELQRVFQGTRSLSELMAERLAQHIPAGAGSPGPRLANIPTIRPVDGGDSHEV